MQGALEEPKLNAGKQNKHCPFMSSDSLGFSFVRQSHSSMTGYVFPYLPAGSVGSLAASQQPGTPHYVKLRP